jgi:hypothetical protein
VVNNEGEDTLGDRSSRSEKFSQKYMAIYAFGYMLASLPFGLAFNFPSSPCLSFDLLFCVI